jgi:hypothetical protein
MESPIMNADASRSRAAKSNGTGRNPQRETKIAGNSGFDSANKKLSGTSRTKEFVLRT